MANAKNKVVFGGVSTEKDAGTLAENLFIGDIDLEEPVKALIKPTVVDYRIDTLRQWGTGMSKATQSGDSAGTTTDNEGDIIYNSETSDSKMIETSSESEQEREVLVPILEDRPTQVYDYNTQIQKIKAEIVNQKPQNAVIKIPYKKACFVHLPTIEDGIANNERVKEFKNKCYNLSDYVMTEEEARKRIEQRLLSLKNSRFIAIPERKVLSKNKQNPPTSKKVNLHHLQKNSNRF